MTTYIKVTLTCLAVLIWFAPGPRLSADAERPGHTTLLRVPNGGIQPQVAVDGKGVVHMIYFTGQAGGGDLYYVRSQDAGATFSREIQVNTQPGSAIASGNIRGAHIAEGKGGRIHVAWMGSRAAEPKGPVPMFYTRLNDAGTAFEPQRNVIQFAYGLDGGGTVAADRSGNVYVVWHAPAPGLQGEGDRRVWIARSTDDGKTFEREKAAYEEPTGACGCCGMGAFADSKGNVFVLYRSAKDTVNRDIYLLASHDKGQSFQGTNVHKWNVGACVMSTQAFSGSPAGVLAAWETQKQVYFGRINPATGKMTKPIAAPGEANGRKHPSVAASRQGESILVWTEGMHHGKGGSLGWQVFDKSGEPIGEKGQASGVPPYSLVAAFARPDGGFTIVY